jgi:NAD(P)-dependent dehydrogenase (short-subunit alcohol dehydrogenase family)
MISAGASGIGRVMAEAYMAAGYRVHVCDSNPDLLQRFRQHYPEAGASLADVADPDSVMSMFSELQREHGRLDVLVNNAGIAGPTARVEDISDEDWSRTLAVDLSGHFYCVRAAVPLLRANGGGSIIFISSNAGLFGFPFRLPYTVSKWGLIGMTKTLAMELGPDKIRVNALCPGSVNGERINGVIERDAQQQGVSAEEIRRLYARQSSLRCFVEPEDVAAMAVFLSSAAGARISGQAIGVDGHTESLANALA